LAIECDGGRRAEPPGDFLPPGSRAAYGEIVAALQSTKASPCHERAEYRIAVDGKFVHRVIETDAYTYYFRHLRDDQHEPPYAILVRLQRSPVRQ